MLRLTAVLVLTMFAICSEWSFAENEPQRVVYEIPSRAAIPTVLNGVREHVASSKTPLQVVIVAYGGGLDLLLAGETDEDGKPFAPAVQALAEQGVQFRACGTTLEFRKIDPKKVIPQGELVPGGRKELERLQKEEGYVLMN